MNEAAMSGAALVEPATRKTWSPTASPMGLACRSCGCLHFFVVYTRRAAGGKLMRRRECRHCGKRMTTVEQET